MTTFNPLFFRPLFTRLASCCALQQPRSRQRTKALLFVVGLVLSVVLNVREVIATTWQQEGVEVELSQKATEDASKSSQDEMQMHQAAQQLLLQRCVSCHGAQEQEGGLRLDSRSAALAGGDSGAAVVVGDADASRLVLAIRSDPSVSLMPPKNPLSAEEISLLEKWIAEGFDWNDTDPPQTVPTDADNASNQGIGDAWSDPRNPVTRNWNGRRLDLWSLAPIREPEMPVVSRADWARTPIDLFVLAKLEAAGIAPGLAAERRQLLRRVSFDLTGLPPEYGDVQEFLADQRPDAFERQVDRLLASPGYGEHVGRLWLDVVRYSDSNGFDWDEFRPLAYRYRDYVIRAMNEDRPYDRFVIEQLAGDELVGDSIADEDEQQALIATGFLRMGPHDNAAPLFNEQDRSRAELMFDLVDTTGAAFLGQTYSCCRCHDHKTDPLLHADYYRLRAYFEAVSFEDDRSIETIEQARTSDSVEAQVERESQVLHGRNQLILDQVKERLLGQGVAESELNDDRLRESADDEERERLAKNLARLEELEAQRPRRPRALLMGDQGTEAPETHVLEQGDYRHPREKVGPGLPSLFDPSVSVIEPIADRSTGRRLALAKWIVSEANPWTYRVIVNRVWQHCFGAGIVPTANDFGWTGAAPSHGELLDHLAMTLRSDDSSLKLLRRRIVTSATYRQAGARVESQQERDRQVAAMQVDPENRLLWRAPLRRLSAEQTRDVLWASSQSLDARLGGPAIWPLLPDEVMAVNPALLDDNETKTKGWYPSPASEQRVRSIYLVQKRTVRVPMMETFDLPENSVSCPRREMSIVAPQALTLLNHPQSIQAAELLAERVSHDGARVSDTDQEARAIDHLFRLVLQRSPDDREREAAHQFLTNRSLAELSRVLLNLNETHYIE